MQVRERQRGLLRAHYFACAPHPWEATLLVGHTLVECARPSGGKREAARVAPRGGGTQGWTRGGGRGGGRQTKGGSGWEWTVPTPCPPAKTPRSSKSEVATACMLSPRAAAFAACSAELAASSLRISCTKDDFVICFFVICLCPGSRSGFGSGVRFGSSKGVVRQ